MRKLVIYIIPLLVCVGVNAQTPASLDSLIVNNQHDISILKGQFQELQVKIRSQERTISALQSSIAGQKEAQESLSSKVSANEETITASSLKLDARIDQVQEGVSGDVQGVKRTVKYNSIFTLIGIVILFGLLALLYRLLRKKTTSIDAIHKAQAAIQEENIKLDGKLVELLEGQMKMATATSTPDHSLALKVADEIVRIETNLSRMDPAVKGYKQLSASIRRIKDNFLANGYEFVDMLGKPYNEGIKAIVTFVTDDDLKEGEQVITGIIKPQINYNGVMIQAAQITVSQNI